jgi:hypothetical protein
LNHTWLPQRESKVADRITGVRCTRPRSRTAASWTSENWGSESGIAPSTLGPPATKRQCRSLNRRPDSQTPAESAFTREMLLTLPPDS